MPLGQQGQATAHAEPDDSDACVRNEVLGPQPGSGTGQIGGYTW